MRDCIVESPRSASCCKGATGDEVVLRLGHWHRRLSLEQEEQEGRVPSPLEFDVNSYHATIILVRRTPDSPFATFLAFRILDNDCAR